MSSWRRAIAGGVLCLVSACPPAPPPVAPRALEVLATDTGICTTYRVEVDGGLVLSPIDDCYAPSAHWVSGVVMSERGAAIALVPFDASLSQPQLIAVDGGVLAALPSAERTAVARAGGRWLVVNQQGLFSSTSDGGWALLEGPRGAPSFLFQDGSTAVRVVVTSSAVEWLTYDGAGEKHVRTLSGAFAVSDASSRALLLRKQPSGALVLVHEQDDPLQLQGEWGCLWGDAVVVSESRTTLALWTDGGVTARADRPDVSFRRLTCGCAAAPFVVAEGARPTDVFVLDRSLTVRPLAASPSGQTGWLASGCGE